MNDAFKQLVIDQAAKITKVLQPDSLTYFGKFDTSDSDDIFVCSDDTLFNGLHEAGLTGLFTSGQDGSLLSSAGVENEKDYTEDLNQLFNSISMPAGYRYKFERNSYSSRHWEYIFCVEASPKFKQLGDLGNALDL